MRILFFGTAEFAVPSLARLQSTGHEITRVVTQPDRPKGRGLTMVVSPVKRKAIELGLPVFQPERVRQPEVLESLVGDGPDAIVVAAFGQLIPLRLLELPRLAPVNVHGSLLPAYRGAAPIHHALMNGERQVGVTTMWMDASLDTGNMLLKHVEDVRDDDDTGSLVIRLADAGAELLLETLSQLELGTCPRTPQDSTIATYAPAITAFDARIDWSESAQKSHGRIRAMSPRPGALCRIGGKSLKVWRAVQILAPVADSPGTVIMVGKDGVDVACGENVLRLLEVQPENGKRMPAAIWANGARIKTRVVFDTVSAKW